LIFQFIRVETSLPAKMPFYAASLGSLAGKNTCHDSTEHKVAMDILNQGRNNIIAVAALVLFGFLYYSLIYRYGLNLADEGNVALISQRLMLGERPFHEVSLGYNVLWFYPISVLFRVFGTNLLLMRVYFYAISTGSSLIAFFLLRRLDAPLWLALAQGVTVIAVTGQYYKAYIPFLVLAHLFALTLFLTSQRKLLLSIGTGFLLGTTFLIRIDLGIFFTLTWLGVIFLNVVLLRGRLPSNLLATASLLLGAAIIHLPFLYDARHRHFLQPFANQYVSVAHLIVQPILPKNPSHVTASPIREVLVKVSPTGVDNGPNPSKTMERSSQLLQRRSFKDIFLKSPTIEKRLLAFLTYAPGLLTCALLGIGLFLVLSGRFSRDRWLLFSALLGGSLTAFPQFFFFRPDLPHLIEFMNGASVALSCAGWLLWSSQGRSRISVAAITTIVFTEVCYLLLTLPNPYGGTLALRMNRNTKFRGSNGVDVILNRAEYEEANTLFSATILNSKKSDYVACYPYLPGINFMAARPTFQRLLYVDDLTQASDWPGAEIEKIRRHRPAVIVIDDWKINGTEGSRFSHWAAETAKYIEDHYRQVASINNKRVFALLTPSPGTGELAAPVLSRDNHASSNPP